MTDPHVQRALDGFRRLVRALRTASVTSERSLGVSAAQLFVLRQLAAHPGLSLGELAERTLTAQSSVSEVVARLASRGLVARETSTSDRRRAEVRLTAEGTAVVRRAPDAVQEQLFAALDRLPTAQRQALAEGLEAWVREAGLAETEPSMFFEDNGS